MTIEEFFYTGLVLTYEQLKQLMRKKEGSSSMMTGGLTDELKPASRSEGEQR